MAKDKSKNIEMITGDPKKAIVKLALPMMLSMLLIMLYNIADSIWVAGLGADALAAIGFITPLFMVLVGLGNGIGAGANSLIARYIGANNYKQANNAALHGIVLSIIVSVIFTVLIEVLMVPILQFMGAGGNSNIEHRPGSGFHLCSQLRNSGCRMGNRDISDNVLFSDELLDLGQKRPLP